MAGTLVQLDATSSPGDVKLAQSVNGYAYAFRGSNTKTFYRYDVAANNWSQMADTPYIVGAGGDLAYDGSNYIYALCGYGTKYFCRYSISSNTWTSLTSTPSAVNAGGALVYTGSYLYALRGGNQRTFWRYSISGNSWTTRSQTPGYVNGGGALTWSSGDYIYAFQGATTTFWRYSISGNSWSTLTAAPLTVGDGGSLANDGSNYVYALRGNNTVTFWRYSISGNSWTTLADTPATPCVYGGGALVYDSNAHFYALRGNNYSDYWKYDVASNTWIIRASVPSTVAYGGALAYKSASAYYASGTLTSSTWDTGSASDFGTISWTATTPASTTLKFQVATNNDSATWNFKGPDGTSSTYYTTSGTTIWTGNNIARYIKYKAYLSTTNTAVTPILSDVSITYSRHVFLPTAITNAATSVEETTATLNGVVNNDGGESCQYRFEYGTASGIYTFTTSWTGSVTTGQTFNAALTGLNQGTMYYFVAQVRNSAGTGTGLELKFLTKPEAPTNLAATPVSASQINLTWTKGIGAVRTKVLRKTGSYPTNYNDGTVVYFDTGTSISDTGLSSNTTYYYRAWSEVTIDSLQQWSDGYAETIATTNSAPSANTNAATLVEETTATLHGVVANDGGEACEYRFRWGTLPDIYTFDTSWTGSVHTGDTFYVDITSLNPGTMYYFVAQVRNSAGIGTGSELKFLTKPEAPTDLTAVVASGSLVNLSWTKGDGAVRTKVLRKTGSYPTNYNDGTVVYFDINTTASDTGLSANTTYYYRAWSEVTIDSIQQWSDGYDETTATTNSAPSATTNAATLVEETTATLHGAVANDGSEACEYRFRWGTSPGTYTFDTSWTGSVHTGDSFIVDITNLNPGTMYYFVAQVRNSAGTGTGSELKFLTKPEAPADLTAVVASGSQVNLTWTKGEGAVRTKVMRKVGSYPTNYNDGTQVYFDTDTNASDSDLSANTTYYYRAWSEVTVDGLQQWSDGYDETTATTNTAPAAATHDATLVEETTATLHGTVTNDGGEDCQYRFAYGTTPGVYNFDTGWTGSVNTGDTFSVDIIGLSKGTKYYFVAQVKNSEGIGSGAELDFLTKPDPPYPFTATVFSDTQIDLTWTKGDGAQKTMIRRSASAYPTSRDEGDLVYFDTGTSFSDTELDPDTQYYYSAWSYASGSEQWSDEYTEATATTSPPPTTPPTTTTTPPTTTTTPPTTTTTPVSVGGAVNHIDKMQIILPWLTIFGFIVLVGGGIGCKLIIVKRNRR